MRLIVSPAKRMNMCLDSLEPAGLPCYIDRTQAILTWMRTLSQAELQKLWGCNNAIAAQNCERIEHMDLFNQLTPAILAYEGIQYQYMAPAVFNEEQLAYVQDHLRILSGFYGVLRALDGVTPYRLEMQAKVHIGAATNLYDYWGSLIHDAVVEDDHTVVNLASKEYSKCIEQHLTPQDTYITCVFGELHNGKVIQKGTYAKMARGEMVRYAADIEATSPEDLKTFDRMSYTYQPSLSTSTTYVFCAQS